MTGEPFNPPARSALRLDWSLFFFAAVVLCIGQWPWIDRVNFELGDFAANSLLIQDAKSLHLLVGNYSRVGFNHPGPAILYVLAFGEWLFADLLHVAKSPFSGQLIAIALYTSFWIVSIFRLLVRISGAATTGAIGLATFLLATAIFDPAFFVGLWFPHVYYFPFAVVLLAGARLASGHTDSLQRLAISAGFAINGHVSFLSTLTFILLGILIFNGLAYRTVATDRSLFRQMFWKLHGREVGFAILTLFLFFVPLLIETAVHFPGPIVQYFSFGSHQSPNTFDSVGRYISVYWGGPRVLEIPVLTLVLMTLLSTGIVRNRDWQALLAMMASATLAMVFYVRYGVDLLDQVYIGFFYYSVPALLATLLALAIVQLDQFRHRILLLTASLCSLIAVFLLIRQPVPYLDQYDQPAVVEIFDALKTDRKEGRTVLDLNQSSDWGTIWTVLLGTQIYAKRQHDDLFCINKGWHISFTVPGRCTPEEAAKDRRLTVRGLNNKPKDGATPVIEKAGLAFYPYDPPNVVQLASATVADQTRLFQDYFLGTGWSGAEPPFVWSDGAESQLILNFPLHFTGTVSFDFGAFIPLTDFVQEISIVVAGKRLATATFSLEDQRKHVDVHLDDLEKARVLFQIRIHKPISPKQAHLSEDPRQLGISLYGFQVTPDGPGAAGKRQ